MGVASAMRKRPAAPARAGVFLCPLQGAWRSANRAQPMSVFKVYCFICFIYIDIGTLFPVYWDTFPGCIGTLFPVNTTKGHLTMGVPMA